MNENIALNSPSRQCVHNSVALCAFTFKIVVLAWNRSKQKKFSLLQFHVYGCLIRPNSLRRLLLSLDRTDFAFKRNNPGWQVCYASLSLSFPQGLSLTFEIWCELCRLSLKSELMEVGESRVKQWYSFLKTGTGPMEWRWPWLMMMKERQVRKWSQLDSWIEYEDWLDVEKLFCRWWQWVTQTRAWWQPGETPGGQK